MTVPPSPAAAAAASAHSSAHVAAPASAATPVTTPAATAGEQFLQLLGARGVDWFLVNSGTDFPSIVEALAGAAGRGVSPGVRTLLVPHENVAVGMAYGATMVTGRPNAVMVHVNVGTANALCGLINAARENVPLLLAAGRTPVREAGVPGARSLNIHWAQEMFDQAGIVREHVKWDYELRDAEQLVTVVDRALAIATTEPRGPVYLALPREALAQAPVRPTPATTSLATPAAPVPDPHAMHELARLLGRARMPVIVTSRAGGDPKVVPALAALADRLAIPVVDFRPRYLSMPADAAMHGGFEIAPWLDEADLVIALDCDVPWIPSAKAPRDDATVVQVGSDPLFARYPLRGFRAELAIVATPATFVEALGRLASRVIEGIGDAAIEARHREIVKRRAARRAAVDAQVSQGAQADPMGLAFVSRTLARALPPDTLWVNEYSLVPAAMDLRVPGCFFGSSPVGGLGWGVPAALGAKLAAPERVVVAGVGDGSYEFANPVACHHAAAMHGLPILTVVLNNGGYGAVDRATRAMYPKGEAAAAADMPLVSLAPQPRFDEIVRACGGHGERVERAADLPGAIARALAAVREERRQALLDVRCA
jgi:acetolactate synthase-1/2/3 large subunit